MTVLRGYAIINKFQSTHPRGVRPDRLRILFRMYIVSIHAPAWGATKSSFGCRGSSAVSIHAPSWGATRSGREQYRDRSRFNPRTRVGCDDRRSGNRAAARGFNPRTRVGCDAAHCPAGPPVRGFNPRTRVGCDGRAGVGGATPVPVSIHAPAWGATQQPEQEHRGHPRFNPRTRVGCDDLTSSPTFCRDLVSIHAPAWGATSMSP